MGFRASDSDWPSYQTKPTGKERSYGILEIDLAIASVITESPLARNQAEETDQSLIVVRHRPHDRVLILIRRALYPIIAQ
jgi:hypothetical protein